MKRVLVGAAVGALWGWGCAIPHSMYEVAPAGSCPGTAAVAPGESDAGAPTLRWFRSEEARDQSLGSAWCETVGEPVVELAVDAGLPPWPQEAPLAVVGWNIAIGGGDVLRFLDEHLHLKCLESGPEAGEGFGPFVLLLQEVYRRSDDLPFVEDSELIPWVIQPDEESGEDLDIEELARRCGLSLVYVPSARNGPDTGERPGEDKGNAILASVPLSEPVAIDLPHEGGRKTAVAATVRSPEGRSVRVVTLHLDVASTLVRTLLTGNQTRVRQGSGVISALEILDRSAPADAATVVAGDFNTWAGKESILQHMRVAFPDSPPWDGQPTRGPFTTDHIFLRRAGPEAVEVERYDRIEDAFHSDHQARILLLRSPIPDPPVR